LVSAYPEAVKRAAILGIPHPFVVAQALTNPEAIHSVFHFWFFQMPGMPEAAMRANDFAFVDYLWNLWSPGHSDPAQIANVKKAFAEPGAVEAALAYYRAMFDPTKQDPALADARSALGKPIKVPTLSLIGGRELIRAASGESQRAFIAADFKFEAVADTSHFLHRERPDEVARLVLDWLQA
jgi:pimeloyl-ACP methyl ester carboxylesterase